MMTPAIQVLADVASAHGVTLQQLRAAGRSSAKLFRARRDAAARLRAERGLSIGQICQLLGGRDYTTIMRMLDEDYRHRHIHRMTARYWRTKAARVDAVCEPTQ